MNDRSGTTIPASSWDRLGIRCVCYRSWTRCIPPRRRCSGPGCGTACAGRSRARRTSPTTGPDDPREQPHLVSRPAHAGVRRRPAAAPHPLPRQGGVVQEPRARHAAAGRAPDPGVPRHRRFVGRARRPRSTRCTRGECVAVFPEGTISQDFEPMRGKSGTARLAQAAGMHVVPIGLWGTHRILTKGRKPQLRGGRVAQVAVVGEPVQIGRRRARAATRRCAIMDAITECVARARAIYPQRPAPGRGRVVVARAGDGGRAPEAGVTRVAVVGAGSWGTAVAAIAAGNVATTLWARRPELAAQIRDDHENPTYLPGIRLPSRLHATASLEEACAGADVLVLGVPSHGLRAVLGEARRVRRAARSRRQPGQGHRAGHARAHDRGRVRGARRSRTGVRRRAHRARTSRARSRPVSRPRRWSR